MAKQEFSAMRISKVIYKGDTVDNLQLKAIIYG